MINWVEGEWWRRRRYEIWMQGEWGWELLARFGWRHALPAEKYLLSCRERMPRYNFKLERIWINQEVVNG